MEGPSLFGGPNEYEGFCMWRAYPSPPLSATRMRHALLVYVRFMPVPFWKLASLKPSQPSDLEGSNDADPSHGVRGLTRTLVTVFVVCIRK